MYFLITCSEDGLDVRQFDSTEAARKALEPDENGDYDYGRAFEFESSIPPIDKGCWAKHGDTTAVLIKGAIVVPIVVQAAVKYKL